MFLITKFVSLFTVEEIDCQVQEIASQMEKNTSQVAQSDKRIDFLEEEIKKLTHLQKNSSRSEQQKDKVCVPIIVVFFN
jgi:hypothetical protein